MCWGCDQSRAYAGSPDSPSVDLPEVHSFPGLLDDQQPEDDHTDLNSIPIAPLPAVPIKTILPTESSSGSYHIPGRSLRGIQQNSLPDCATYIDYPGGFSVNVHGDMAPVIKKPGVEMTIKKETTSPLDPAIPGTSSAYLPTTSQPHNATSRESNSPRIAPVIPLTALELVSKDSSESSSGDEVFSSFLQDQPIPAPARKNVKSSGSSIGEASGKSSRITVHRKSDLSSPQSDDGSSDDGFDESQVGINVL